jgi:hypothetical protein
MKKWAPEGEGTKGRSGHLRRKYQREKWAPEGEGTKERSGHLKEKVQKREVGT